ncbi:hypothetical protein Taro_045355 [Colocasia esculenta]|uniref:Uncharacterized protein n=1 Tax=Colocasia esculenta TaxID=4460 RepID=A0A843X430_COLES|nr:hypothetical protein [Colocasia esculenta]
MNLVSALGQVRMDAVVSPARHECMEWQERQPPVSVVYVSFEMTSSLPEQQITELAHGLERSRQRFIWVLREADRADIFAGDDDGRQKLPDGYEQRVAGVGLVVRGWAPQLDILGHSATALFMSHCRWNSCMEGLSNGVSIATWPLHSDQPKNALLVTEVLQVGVTARLALPCCVSFFRQVLELLDLDEDRFKGLDLEGFLEVGYLCEAESPDLFSCSDEVGASDGYNGFSSLLTKAGYLFSEPHLAVHRGGGDGKDWHPGEPHLAVHRSVVVGGDSREAAAQRPRPCLPFHVDLHIPGASPLGDHQLRLSQATSRLEGERPTGSKATSMSASPPTPSSKATQSQGQERRWNICTGAQLCLLRPAAQRKEAAAAAAAATMAETMVLKGVMKGHTNMVMAIVTTIDNSDMVVSSSSRDKFVLVWHLTKDLNTWWADGDDNNCRRASHLLSLVIRCHSLPLFNSERERRRWGHA